MASITKRAGKGGAISYRIRVSCGLDARGNQLSRSMTWKPPAGMKPRAAEKEVLRVAMHFEEECDGLSSSGSMKFEDFCREWFSLYAEKQLRPTTVARLHKHEPRVYQALGHIRLDKLNARQIQSFLNNLQVDGVNKMKRSATPKDLGAALKKLGLTQKAVAEKAQIGRSTLSGICKGERTHLDTAQRISKALNLPLDELFTVEPGATGLAPKTVRLYASFISSVLSYAVKLGAIPSNPAERVDLPPLVQRERQIYTLEEAQAFLDSLKDAPIKYRAFCVLAIYSGLRRGELLGLEWGDLDFDNQVITVRRTSLYTKEKGVFTDTTKTLKSQRALKLPAAVFDLLKQLRTDQKIERLRQGDHWICSDRLFVGERGNPMNPGTPYHWLERFCKETGQKFYGVHTFRHLNATLLIDSGADVRTVSRMLGHSTATTTLNIYAHSFEEAQARAGEAVAAALEGKVKFS
jgi:integrase